MGQHIGIAAADDPAQRIVFTGDDQILQVDGPGKDAVHHIQRGDIVVLTGLPHQLVHGAADGQCVRDADEIAAHAAADLLLMKGQQPPDILPGVVVQMGGQSLLLLRRKLPQHIQRIRRVHVGDHRRRQIRRKFRQEAGGIVQIGEYLCQRPGIQLPEQPLPLRIRQQGDGLGHIPLVIVLQQLRQTVPVLGRADDRCDFLCELLVYHSVHHILVLLWRYFGQNGRKNTPPQR